MKVGDIVNLVMPYELTDIKGIHTNSDYVIEDFSYDTGRQFVKIKGTWFFKQQFKLKEKKFETSKERILEIEKKCPNSRSILMELFPDVFIDKDIKMFADTLNKSECICFEWYNAMPGDTTDEKARLFFENYIKPNMKL